MPNRSPPRTTVPNRAFRIEEDRLSASIGPTSSKASTGITRKVATAQARPAGDADEAADEPEPLLEHADGRPHDGRQDRPA